MTNPTSSTIPPRASAEFLKKQAKKLLRAFRENQAHALNLIAKFHPAPDSFNSLRDAQLTLARYYGQLNWDDLLREVEIKSQRVEALQAVPSEMIDLACVSYRAQDSSLRYKKAQRMLQTHAELSEYNLISAIISHNADHATKLLQHNPQLARQCFGPRDWPPILYLTYNRVPDLNHSQAAITILKLLLELGAEVNAHFIIEHNYRFTALTGAMGEGEGGLSNQPPHQYAEELAIMLLEAGAEPNDSQGLYNTMFTDSGDKWLRLLVTYGLNKHHKVNWTPEKEAGFMFDYLLETAIRRGRTDRAEYLLSLGANPNASCHYAKHSIYTAARLTTDRSLIELLREHGGEEQVLSAEDAFVLSVRTQDIVNIQTLLSEHPELLKKPQLLNHATPAILQIVLDRGYDINQTDETGKTALHILSGRGNLESVKWLVQHGADVHLRDDHYQGKAVGHAHFNQQFAVRDYLLKHDVYPLETAACGALERLKQLLEQDPSLVHFKGFNGNTMLHVVCNWLGADALYETSKSIIQLLINHGASINEVNANGRTPLQFNADENNGLIETILTEYTV